MNRISLVLTALLAVPTFAAAKPSAKTGAIEALAAKLAYPKAAGTYAMRLTKAQRKAAGEAAAKGIAVVKDDQTDVYATTDAHDAILAHYHKLLTKQGWKNVSPKSEPGNIMNSGYEKGGLIVTLTAVGDPNNNVSLEKGQSIPNGHQAVVVVVSKGP